MMKLLFLCIIYAIVNGKQWKNSDVVEEIVNLPEMMIHERARLYGAEEYMTIKTIIDLKDWKEQEKVFYGNLEDIIKQETANHVEYMDALLKRSSTNLEETQCRQNGVATFNKQFNHQKPY